MSDYVTMRSSNLNLLHFQYPLSTMDPSKLKVLVVGPAQSGKTRAVNTLAAISTQGVYDPTVGCRIIELERPLSVRDAKSKKEMQVVANVELWDLSGDVKYESCWPACQKDAHGVILVLEALQLTVNETAPEKSLDFWFQSFAARMGLDPSQVFVMVLGTDEQSVNSQVTSAGKLKLAKLPPGVMSVQSHHMNGELIEREFDSFLSRIYGKSNH